MKLSKLLENEFTNKSHGSDVELRDTLKLKVDSLDREITNLYQKVSKVGETLQVSDLSSNDVSRYAENGKISMMWDGLTSEQQQLYYATKKTCSLIRTLSVRLADVKADYEYVNDCISSDIQVDQHKLYGSYTYDNSNY